MKRAERHHLKENDLQVLARQAREVYGTRKREISWVIAAAVIAAVVGVGYLGWREHVQSAAGATLAEAMAVQDARIGPPPAPGTTSLSPYFPTEGERSEAALLKFKAAADAYPSTDAGVFARYRQAALLMSRGRHVEAAKAYQQVIDAARGDKILGQMARLGEAQAQAQQGQYDQAINTFKALAQRKDGTLPIDGILMELGRTYLQAGKAGDAKQAFTRLVQEFPESPFNADAKRELDNLKST